nr:unnamed protein product [Digitaria exilis]
MRSLICRVLSVLGNRVSKLTLKDVTRKCSVPSTHVYSGRQTDKIALGKIERSVQAVGAALKKLETGDNVNDAKAVCEPDVLKQLSKWHVSNYSISKEWGDVKKTVEEAKLFYILLINFTGMWNLVTRYVFPPVLLPRIVYHHLA